MSFSDKITFFSSGKVFSKLSYNVPKLTIKDVVECKAGVIEVVLANIRLKVSAPIKIIHCSSRPVILGDINIIIIIKGP